MCIETYKLVFVSGNFHCKNYVFFCVVKGPEVDALNAQQLWGLLCNPVMKIIIFFIFASNGASVEWNSQGETEVLGGEKPVPVLHRQPQIPNGLTRDRTRASVVRARRLTAWAMARPKNYVTNVKNNFFLTPSCFLFHVLPYNENCPY
jgi:hypothetical protein